MLSLHSHVEGVASRHEEKEVYITSMKVVHDIVMRFLSSQELEFTLPPEEKSHGTISITTYYMYFKAGANLFVLAIMLVFFVLGEVRT